MQMWPYSQGFRFPSPVAAATQCWAGLLQLHVPRSSVGTLEADEGRR